jgi:hypothetical protein
MFFTAIAWYRGPRLISQDKLIPSDEIGFDQQSVRMARSEWTLIAILHRPAYAWLGSAADRYAYIV